MLFARLRYAEEMSQLHYARHMMPLSDTPADAADDIADFDY
jgi:hypothetical protein